MYEHELPSFCCFLLPASGTYTPISKSAKLSLQARNQDSWRLCRSPSQTPSQTIALRFLHCLLGGTMEWIFCCTYFSPLMVCLASWPDVFFFLVIFTAQDRLTMLLEMIFVCWLGKLPCPRQNRYHSREWNITISTFLCLVFLPNFSAVFGQFYNPQLFCHNKRWIRS